MAKKSGVKEKAATTTTGKQAAKKEPAGALTPFEEMDRAFERMFERFFPPVWMRPARWEWPSWGGLPAPFEGKHPRVDVIEHDTDITVKAELPGVEKKDVDVSVTENTVTIKGASGHEKEETKGDYYRREISRGSFSRTVSLPGDVDSSKAKANFKDGVLELIIPKVEKSKRRRITVE